MFTPLSLGALNHLLGQADWARQRLAPFAGRTARLSMPPWQMNFRIGSDGHLEAGVDTEPDVTMTLPADAPLRALQGQDKVIEAARVEGNAQFATELSFVLRNLRWDAGEDLSRLVGDVAAHRMVQGAAGFAAWQKDAARRFSENLAEYVTEENPMLLRPQDIAPWVTEVGQLRDAIEQLDRRIENLAA